MPGMFSKYGNRGRKDQDNQPEEITQRTEFDLSNPSNVSSGGRYDLSSGVTDQMRFDYQNRPASDKFYDKFGGGRGGMSGKYGGNKSNKSPSDRSVLKYAESTNKEDAQRFAETKGRRSAMNYILKLPSIRGIGVSNRGMAASSSRLGM